MKEFCKCGHSKKFHLIEFDRTVCCAMWQSKNTGYVTGCECSNYIPEDTQMQKHFGSKIMEIK